MGGDGCRVVAKKGFGEVECEGRIEKRTPQKRKAIKSS